MEETTAEFTVADLAAEVPLRFRPRVTIACKTDLGRVRENNEDKFEYFLPEDDRTLASRGQVFVVCDGMGGHAAGQIASEIAAKTFIDVYLHHPSADIAEAATSAVIAANRFVLDVGRTVSQRRGMGTTLSALLLVQDAAWIVQVGDSRVYRLRDGELTRLTRDHTWLEEVVRTHMLSPALAAAHPNRHMLLRAIGAEDVCEPDVEPDVAMVGDTFLLCSDGLLNHATDEEIHRILSSYAPSEAAWRLVAHALVGGGSDNCTVMIVRVDALEPVSDVVL
ncbi:MAG: serine/threonine-protein phosphatase [Fimbriimonadaceae bacterium]|nr:serine/threonine-protein phosphatase [Fimbriimonadaceae bacterium]